MIYFLSPVPPEDATSGGTRKLGDLSCILQDAGIDSRVVNADELKHVDWQHNDLVVVPEVYGHGLDTLIPRGVKRVGFVQNGYLIDQFGMAPGRDHPYMDTPNLLAVMVESQHSADLVRLRLPNLRVPIIMTHSSGNGRMGNDGPFSYGAWPRKKYVTFFGYKHGGQNAAIFDDLLLPDGWSTAQLTGTDEDVAAQLRSCAIFAAPNTIEGLCAPTQEAMISGSVIVAWPGGPSRFAHHPTPGWSYALQEKDPGTGGPMEYLKGRSVVVPQDDTQAFRKELWELAKRIDADPNGYAAKTKKWSLWHRTNYSREREKNEIVRIMQELGVAN